MGLEATVDGVSATEWDALVANFEDATVYQTWAYETVRSGEGRVSHLILKDEGRVIAAAQLRVMRVPVLGCGVAYAFRGPLWRLRGETPSTGRFRQVLRALHSEYVVKRGLLLRLAPNERDEASGEMAAILESEGFGGVTGSYRHRSLLMDLEPPMEALRKTLRHSWRTNLNKACARDFTFAEGVDDALYAQFLNLYGEMHGRKQFVENVDVNQFRTIQSQLPDPFKLRIAVCSLEGEPVSAAVCDVSGGVAKELFMATSSKALETQGAYRLLWEQIQWLKDHGIRHFDLGGIDPEANPGGYRFKSGLGGWDVQHIGDFEACASVLSRCMVRGAERARAAYRGLRSRRPEKSKRAAAHEVEGSKG